MHIVNTVPSLLIVYLTCNVPHNVQEPAKANVSDINVAGSLLVNLSQGDRRGCLVDHGKLVVRHRGYWCAPCLSPVAGGDNSLKSKGKNGDFEGVS